MAQENANILHAAIQIRGDGTLDPAVSPPEILAQTGIEVDSVRLRQDLPAIATDVLEVDLVTGIDDAELFAAWMTGTIQGPEEIDGVPTAAPNSIPDNIMRPTEASDAATEKRRFWIALVGGVHSFHVSWWRIPQLTEAIPTGFVPAPAPPPP